nr:RNA polymerase subunit sigma-70 [Hamadaea tsunoensis]
MSDLALIAAATAGDEEAFGRLVARHRRELHIHCYRLLGSFEDAEDALQDTLVRAWRHRAGFDGGPNYRAWLYKIATNTTLDLIRARKRRVPAAGSYADIPWLQPYPDRLLDEAAPAEDQPDAVVVAKETIELAYLATIQLLPPRQRAVLILRDVLAWPARETAAALDLTEAAANSALQRARATLARHRPAPAAPSAYERDLLRRMIDAHERADAEAALALLREDIRVTMPPLPMLFDGYATVEPLLRNAFGDGSIGDWKLVPVRANRMPAAASYLRKWGDSAYRAFKIDVLRVEGDKVVEMTTFDERLFPAFDLPLIWTPARDSSG